MSDEIKVCTPLTSHPTIPLDALVSRILLLAEAMCEKHLFKYQKEFGYRIIEAVLLHEGEMLTALLARQSGKSETIGATVAACGVILPTLANTPIFADDWRLNCTDTQGNYRGYKNGVKIGIYAPIQEQADIAFTRVKDTLQTATSKQIIDEIDMGVTIANGNKLWMTNGTKIRSQSASEQSKIEGESFHLLILDEAQDIGMVKIRKCFSEDTLFVQSDGTRKTIKEVVQEQLPVLTPNGFVSEGVEYHTNGVQDVFEITTSEGKKLSVTENHRNLVRTRTRRVPFMAKTQELQEGWQIAVPDSLPYFGNEGTWNQGYVLGLTLGDGCVSGDKPLLIIDSREKPRLDKALEDFGVTAKVYKEQPSGMLELGLTNEGNCKGSNGLTGWFKEIGVWGYKRDKKHVPSRPWSKDFLKGLVEGLIIADGCVELPTVKPVISFANCSEDLVDVLQFTLMKFGIHGVKHEGFMASTGSLPGTIDHPGTYMYRLHIKKAGDIRRFGEVFDLGYKQDLVVSSLSTIYGKKGRERSQFYTSDMRFVKIKSIRKKGQAQTYCVTVPTKDHLVITDGFVSGNSLHPMVAAYNGTLVKIGTCSTEKSDFYLSIKANKRYYAQGGPKNHFEYNYKICETYNSMYKQFIDKEKVRLGEESDEFKLSYTCLLPGTRIVRGNGQITVIEKARVGQCVVSHKGKSRRILETCSKIVHSTVYGIVAAGTNIPVWITPEHKVHTERGWIEAQHLTIKDKLVEKTHAWHEQISALEIPASVRARQVFGNAKLNMVLADEIRECVSAGMIQKDVATKYGMSRPSVSGICNYNIWTHAPTIKNTCHLLPDQIELTEDMGEFMGWFIAEGHANKANGVISFALNAKTEQHVANRLVRLAKKLFGFDAHIRLKETALCVEFGCVELVRLFTLWFGRGAKNKSLPPWFFKAPKSFVCAFLRAYWQGDGHVRERGGVFSATAGTVSDTLAHQLIEVFKRFQIPASLYQTKINDSYINGRHIRGGVLYQVWLYGLDSKDIFSFKGSGKGSRVRFDNRVLTRLIKRIDTKPYHGKIYDITTNVDHSFCTPFVPLHNCTWLLERGQFITDKQLMNSKVAMVTGKYRHLYRNSPRHVTVVAGVDFGKVHDPTVVTVLAVDWANPIADEWIDTPETSVHFVAYQKHIISWQMILGDNYEDQFTQITQYLSCFKGLRKITVDATGVGQWGLDKFIVHYSNFDRGKAMDGSPDISYVEVEGVNFNISSKSEMYKILHADLCTGRTTFPAGIEVRTTRLFRRFVGEMLDLRKNYRNGYMCCEAPAEPGAHDDFCDSLALANWCAQTPSDQGTIDVSQNTFFGVTA